MLCAVIIAKVPNDFTRKLGGPSPTMVEGKNAAQYNSPGVDTFTKSETESRPKPFLIILYTFGKVGIGSELVG